MKTILSGFGLPRRQGALQSGGCKWLRRNKKTGLRQKAATLLQCCAGKASPVVP